MTFDRFYSIIRPHKAASFNTVKRAKIIIASIVISSIVYNTPHLYLSSNDGPECLPYGNAMEHSYGEVYYRSGTVNSKSFVGKVLIRIKWKIELINDL